MNTYYMYAQCVCACMCVLCDVLAEEAKESGFFVRSSLATSAGRVLQHLMELQCTRWGILPAESVALQTVIDHHCSSNVRRCLYPHKLSSIAPLGLAWLMSGMPAWPTTARHPTVSTPGQSGVRPNHTSPQKDFSWL